MSLTCLSGCSPVCCLPVWLSAYLFVCLTACPSVTDLSVCLLVCLSVSLYICLSVCTSACLSVPLPDCQLDNRLVCLLVCLAVYMSVALTGCLCASQLIVYLLVFLSCQPRMQVVNGPSPVFSCGNTWLPAPLSPACCDATTTPAPKPPAKDSPCCSAKCAADRNKVLVLEGWKAASTPEAISLGPAKSGRQCLRQCRVKTPTCRLVSYDFNTQACLGFAGKALPEFKRDFDAVVLSVNKQFCQGGCVQDGADEKVTVEQAGHAAGCTSLCGVHTRCLSSEFQATAQRCVLTVCKNFKDV